MALGDAIRGTLGAFTTGRTAEQEPDVRRTLLRHNIPGRPLASIVLGKTLNRNFSPVPQRGVKSYGKFSWFEADQIDHSTTTTAEASAVATALSVTNAKIFSQCSLVRVTANPGGTTGEIFWVSAAVSSDTSLTIKRAMGGTTANIIKSGATITRLATAVPEDGYTSVGAIEGNRTEYWGTTQEMWREIKMTKRRRAAAAYYGYDWPQEWMDAADGMLEDFNRACFLNGDADVTTTDASSYRIITMAGFDGVIATCVYNSSGNTAYLDFCDYILAYQNQNIRRAKELRPLLFAAPRCAPQLAEWGLDKVRMEVGQNGYGLSVERIIVPGFANGYVDFCWDPTLTDTDAENDVFGINIADLELRYLVEGPPDNKSWKLSVQDQNKEDITAVGDPTKAWRAVANVGLQIMREPGHFRIRNFANRSI